MAVQTICRKLDVDPEKFRTMEPVPFKVCMRAALTRGDLFHAASCAAAAAPFCSPRLAAVAVKEVDGNVDLRGLSDDEIRTELLGIQQRIAASLATLDGGTVRAAETEPNGLSSEPDAEPETEPETELEPVLVPEPKLIRIEPVVETEDDDVEALLATWRRL